MLTLQPGTGRFAFMSDAGVGFLVLRLIPFGNKY